jgi:hypothetical protein
MRKRIAVFATATMVAATMSFAGVAFGAEHHPPKFHVHSKQCTGKNNQPNCPGGH